MLASQGYAEISVYPALKVGILTTGDELVSPGQPRSDEHIYNRSEEHTSELQSLMRTSYAVFCLKKKKNTQHEMQHHYIISTATTNAKHTSTRDHSTNNLH